MYNLSSSSGAIPVVNVISFKYEKGNAFTFATPKGKNISSELLSSFGWQLTKEDISVTDMHGISDNWIKYSKGSDVCQE